MSARLPSSAPAGRYDLKKGFAGTTVLVTGGGGLIGSRIVSRLRQLGSRPIALCTLDAYPAEVYRNIFGMQEGPELVLGDVTDAPLMRRLVSDCDYVIHAAALADVAACTRTPGAAITANILGTQSVLSAAAASERLRRLTFVSSASVYGNGAEPASADSRAHKAALESVFDRLPVRFREDAGPLDPVSVYANTKAWGEAQTRVLLGDVGTSYSVVRYFSVYGEPQVVKQNSHSWVVAWFSSRAALGLPLHLHGGGHQIRDLVHVADITEATLRSLIAPDAHNATVNVGTGVHTSIREVADLVLSHFPGVRLMETPMPPGDPLGGYACTRRMEQVLGWRPTITIAEGVDRYVRWLQQTPAALPDWLRTADRAS
ncbi:NAD-dependent epimerase/dehydratase family protein [Streptomyces sp. MS2.AVA.5]|uniref:NAD-dependent epimerase/dehydratase family protein n=1 Tax=Streptomyces achmelvichensis TaxID=3134111 RepID=A0ACC6Q953_9ACTN